MTRIREEEEEVQYLAQPARHCFFIGCVSVSITLFFLLGHHYETSEINSQWFRDHAIKFLAKFLGHNLDNLAKNVTTGKATRPKGLQNDASAGLPDPTSA